MALRKIITLPDARLRLKCAPVPAIDASIRALMDDMLETMYAAPGIGLARSRLLCQSGSSFSTWRNAKTRIPPIPLVSSIPEILWTRRSFHLSGGCLSIPDFFEDVERPARVRARISITMAAPKRLRQRDLATCLQHEIDHLNGILFIDHLSRLKRDRITRKFAKTAKHGGPLARAGQARRGRRAGA